MKRFLQRFALLLVVVCCGLVAKPQAQINPGNEPELIGHYTVAGANPDGKPYTGTLEIRKRDQHFQVRWELESGEVSYGFGFVHEGHLMLTIFSDPQSGQQMAPTLAVYSVSKPDPLTLEGRWAVIAAPGIHEETLVKVTPGHPAKKPLPKPTHRL